MNWREWFITLARLGATGLSVAGQASLSRIFNKIGDAAQANENVEAHMALVKENLDSGPIDSTDWDAVEGAITANQARIDKA